MPWTVSIPPEKRDRDFGDKLKAEASGILNRLLAGLVDWLKHGLNSPAEIEQATADYRKDSDPLGRFLDACVETKEGERVQSSGVASTVLRLVSRQWRKGMDRDRPRPRARRARLSRGIRT
jgi:putative DNA primase/helicase